METSLDGKEWTTIYEKKKGGGGTDKIFLDETTECRYIRLSEFDKQGRRNPTLAEIEVYGSEARLVSEQHQQTGVIKQWYEMKTIIIIVAIIAVVVAAVFVGVIVKKKRKKS